MPRDGSVTRERLLDVAEALVLEQGFAATRVERIIADAAVAKGGFFHHFPSKSELARALVRRWADRDLAELEEALARVERLSSDPLQQVLLLVALFEEAAPQIMSAHSGCLYASFTYERGILDEGTSAIVEEASRTWRERLLAKLEDAAARYPPRLPVDLEALADQLLVVFEGAFVVSRTLDEPQVMAAQLRNYRSYLELLFGPSLQPGS
jgi:TetR/AcrR family transcriptional regulator, transcriptional repressor for nem operon